MLLKMKIHQAHDKLFKETFGDVTVAQDFLQHYLPSSLLKVVDLASLEISNDSFIEEGLQDSRSDLLYGAMIDGEKSYVYFLFEHKSYPTKDIALQLLGYMLEIWKREVNKKKADTLPPVLPLVIYHGESRWKSPRLLRDWIVNYDDLTDDMTKSVPDFTFWLYDFSYDNDLAVLGNAKLRAYLQLMKHIFSKNWAQLIQVIVQIEALLMRYGYGKYFNTIILYILHSRKHVPIDKIQRQLTDEGRKRFMTTAEELMREGKIKGKQEGIIEGKAEGKVEGKIEVVKNALQLNMDIEQISQLTGLSVNEIKKIKREVTEM